MNRFQEPLGQTPPPNAAAFIVTVYGDLVEPRGGVLWMGSLISVCAAVGLSESVVRTAVSRLVAAGQLTGEKEGRRSYYRLTAKAAQEFTAASRIIFGGASAPKGLIMAACEDAVRSADLLRQGFARLGGGQFIASDAWAQAADDLPVMDVMPRGEISEDWARRIWALDDIGKQYQEFVAAVATRPDTSDATGALGHRLLLVDWFRSILLREPRLPANVLAADWPGHAARRAFAQAYLSLTPLAQSAIDALQANGGPLPVDAQALAPRQTWLERDAQ